MPYSSVADVPDYVPKGKRRQWLAVFNSAWKRAKKDGKSDKDAEASAFAQANAVAGPNSSKSAGGFKGGWVGFPDGEDKPGKITKAVGTEATGFVRAVDGPFKCGHCAHMEKSACHQAEVIADPEVQDELNADGFLPVESGDCCNEYDPVEKEKSMKPTFKKFIPFVKVDVAKREVSGIVTAEVPDKEDEVCDYEGSKPFYQAVITEMAKATDGKNFFPLREMHQLSAVGKCTGFEFRDTDKEIVMTFKVVDDDAWKKVDEGVYTGFSQGGSLVGDLVPDPVYKGCKRYTADPSEVSLVDNPCLGVAHFAYVKTDGAVELRKFKKIEDAAVVSLTRLQGLIDAVEELKKAKATAPAKPKVDDAVKKLLIGVRVPVRKFVNAKSRTSKRFPAELARLDNDLGYLTRKHPLVKGLYTVGRLAEYIEGLAYMLCSIVSEEEWEGEESTVPGLLAENVNGLLDTFLAYAEEEAEELREEVTARA